MEGRQPFPIWSLAALLLIVVGLISVPYTQVRTLAYSDFQGLLADGRIKDVEIGEGSLSVTADLRGAQSLLPPVVVKSLPKEHLEEVSFVTARVSDPNLVSQLQTVHVHPAGCLRPDGSQRSCYQARTGPVSTWTKSDEG